MREPDEGSADLRVVRADDLPAQRAADGDPPCQGNGYYVFSLDGALLNRYIASAPRPEQSDEALDPETLRQLRSLGYIE